MTRADFSVSAGNLLCTLNHAHAFREGNGRTQREFISQLATFANHPLDWTVVSQERMISASIDSVNGNTSPMQRLIEEISDPQKTTVLGDAIAFLESHDINWNQRYLATTIVGLEYEGILVSHSAKHFILMTTEQQIIIGFRSDLPMPRVSNAKIYFKATR